MHNEIKSSLTIFCKSTTSFKFFNITIVEKILVCVFIMLFINTSQVKAQKGLDEELFRQISSIKAIDNHAHPLKYVEPGGKPDDEFDALPIDAIPPFALPVRLNATNPEFIQAWKELYNYPYKDMTEEHVKELMVTKQKLIRKLGESFPSWILSKINIETMFSNRIAMGPGLTSPNFRWVAFDDALLFPLSNEAAKKSNPDYGGFYPGEEKLLKRYLNDLNISNLPSSLDVYLKTVVSPTLERQKHSGAIAIKFEAAYLRKLDFDNPNDSIATITYSRFIKGGVAPPGDYKALQDFLFYFIAKEAGRLGMAVHIHCLAGVGGYFNEAGSDPLLLESVFNDSSLRKTNFVLLHGGYPYTKEMGLIMGKPNVYADFSLQTLVTYPRELSQNLRNWLETYPDKILFGTDSFSFGPEVDWGEVAWLSNHTARQALALALTEMINDDEITHLRAMELAKMVLHDNASKLYGIK